MEEYKLLDSIKKYYVETGFFPTYAHLLLITKKQSTSTMHSKMMKLEEEGLIVFSESRKSYRLPLKVMAELSENWRTENE